MCFKVYQNIQKNLFLFHENLFFTSNTSFIYIIYKEKNIEKKKKQHHKLNKE